MRVQGAVQPPLGLADGCWLPGKLPGVQEAGPRSVSLYRRPVFLMGVDIPWLHPSMQTPSQRKQKIPKGQGNKQTGTKTDVFVAWPYHIGLNCFVTF